MPPARLAAFVLPVLLAACAAAPPPPGPSFRDAGVPIASTTRGTILDLAGDWEVAESFPGDGLAPPGTRLSVAPQGEGALLRFEGPGGARAVAVGPGLPGRLVPLDGSAELWLLWADDGFRTAAVGTPGGGFGWIMHRPGQAAPDRTAAAREVLDWMGYDVARLAAGAGSGT